MLKNGNISEDLLIGNAASVVESLTQMSGEKKTFSKIFTLLKISEFFDVLHSFTFLSCHGTIVKMQNMFPDVFARAIVESSPGDITAEQKKSEGNDDMSRRGNWQIVLDSFDSFLKRNNKLLSERLIYPMGSLSFPFEDGDSVHLDFDLMLIEIMHHVQQSAEVVNDLHSALCCISFLFDKSNESMGNFIRQSDDPKNVTLPELEDCINELTGILSKSFSSMDATKDHYETIMDVDDLPHIFPASRLESEGKNNFWMDTLLLMVPQTNSGGFEVSTLVDNLKKNNIENLFERLCLLIVGNHQREGIMDTVCTTIKNALRLLQDSTEMNGKVILLKEIEKVVDSLYDIYNLIRSCFPKDASASVQNSALHSKTDPTAKSETVVKNEVFKKTGEILKCIMRMRNEHCSPGEDGEGSDDGSNKILQTLLAMFEISEQHAGDQPRSQINSDESMGGNQIGISNFSQEGNESLPENEMILQMMEMFMGNCRH